MELFKRFYADRVPAHALPHSLDVIKRYLEIIENDPEISLGDINLADLIIAALAHDLSCIISRNNHEENSAIWIEAILRREGKYNELSIQKVGQIAKGHKKTKGKGPREEHLKYVEARILHDADMLSVIFNPEQIYKSKLGWSIEDSGYDKTRPLSANRFFEPDETRRPNGTLRHPEQTLAHRITVIEENRHYSESDGVNDLFYKVLFQRREEKLFLTEGAKNIIRGASKDLAVVTGFIEEKRDDLKQDYGLSEQEINQIIRILTDLYNHFFTQDKIAPSDLAASRVVKIKPSRFLQHMVNEFGLGEILNVQLVHGGAGIESEPFPVIETPKGKFAIKRLKVESTEDARFIMDYVRYLKENGIPIPLIRKQGSEGKIADDFFTAFSSEDTGEERFYSVEPWVEGREISRKDVSPATLKAVGRMLGKIHKLACTYSSTYKRHPEHYSLERAIKTVVTSGAVLHAELESRLTREEMSIIDTALSEVNSYWTPERFKLLSSYMQLIPSDLNFGNIIFNETGEEIIAIFDWDNARIGYRFEDLFATLVQTGRRGESYHIGKLQEVLATFLEGYQETTQPLFTQEEIDALPTFFTAQILYRIVLFANSIKGKPVKENIGMDGIKRLTDNLQTIKDEFMFLRGEEPTKL